MFGLTMNSKTLADLCRRLAVSSEAGLDVRKTWAREASVGPAGYRGQLRLVSEAVERGDSITDGVARTHNCFPRLFREMIEVGEKTGTLTAVLRRLAEHYEHRAQVRRQFLASLTWPLVQLGIAVTVVGLLIWLMGVIAQHAGGKPIDLLGFGLVGTRGLEIYIIIVQTAALAVVLVIWAMLRGWFWARPLQRWALKVPVLGGALETIALARIAWALHLTLDVDMPLAQVLPLVLRASGNDHYIRTTRAILADIQAGESIHESFAHTGAFHSDFLALLAVAEESGTLVESMERLSRQYEERAQVAVSTLTWFAGFMVWAAVATMIVFLIFRIASFYINTLNQALKF